MNMLMAQRRWWLVLILLVGLGLRLWGLAFGLPELYHQDEQVTVNVALKMGMGDLNPHYFFHPHLVHYLLFGLYGVTYLLGHAVGWFAAIGDFERLFVTDPTLFYLLGRLLGVAFGTMTIYVVYRLGERLWSARVGLWAAGALAVCFLHVRNSHYIRHDVPSACLMAVCILWWATARWARARDTLMAGFLLGLAITANWSSALLLPWLFLYLGTRHTGLQPTPSWWAKTILAAGLGMFLGILLASPFVILDVRSLFHVEHGVGDFLSRAGVLKSSVVPVGQRPNWITHYPQFLWIGMGGAPLLLGILGTAWVLVRGTRAQRLLALFPVAYYGVVGQVPFPLPDYLMPILPFLCLTAAVAFWEGWDRLPRLVAVRPAAAVALTALIVGWSAVQSVYEDRLLTRVDTRTLAKRWIETHLPPGTRVALEAYTVMSAWVPRLSEQPEQQQLQLAAFRQLRPGAGRLQELRMKYLTPAVSYELIELSRVPRPNEQFANHYDFDKLLQQDVSYVVISGYWMGCRGNPRQHPVESRFYQMLRDRAELVAEFAPFRSGVEPFFDIPGAHTPFLHVMRLGRPGPVIQVYRLPERHVVHEERRRPNA